jgi:ribosome biogenesis GTPase
MNARIVALDFGNYIVDVNGRLHTVHLPKTLRMKYPPIVGDFVTLDVQLNQILEVHPRRTYLHRPRIANLDHIFLVNSLVEPDFSFNLLMTFMSFAAYYELTSTVVFTKLDKASLSDYPNEITYLKNLHVDMLTFNKFEAIDTQLFMERIKGKTVAFAGQTGVGKSSLMNALNPNFQREIGSYSQALGRGKHETKEVIMVPFASGFLVDTPGFSSLVLPMLKSELAHLFPGFKRYLGVCKFANCLHLDEPGCKIKEDVSQGRVPLQVYQTYQKLLETCKEKKEYV